VLRAKAFFVHCFLVVGIALGATGCTVGQGNGAAKGELFVLGCSSSGDYCSDGVCGTEATLAPFDLKPGFFAGEPINDPRLGQKGTLVPANRLVIRLQRSGVQQDRNDVLTFDIPDSYEVARCVRGRKFVDGTGALVPDWDPQVCERADDAGPARLRIHPDAKVHASLSPWSTCASGIVAKASAQTLADLRADPTGSQPKPWESWIDLQEFGDAGERDTADPQMRKPIDRQFHVRLGQRVQATAFQLLLLDAHLLWAIDEGEPVPPPIVGGTLAGYFDFDLARGQGAQTFP
jgi:hypothetical protein